MVLVWAQKGQEETNSHILGESGQSEALLNYNAGVHNSLMAKRHEEWTEPGQNLGMKMGWHKQTVRRKVCRSGSVG